MQDYKVLLPFRYVVDGLVIWVTPETHPTIKLPGHAAQVLARGFKVKLAKEQTK